MCDPLSLLFGVAGGEAAKAVLPKPPKIPEPQKPPQATRTADRNEMRNGNMGMPGGSMAGNGSTFLTGAGGVDPTSLNLGRNTLLGQ